MNNGVVSGEYHTYVAIEKFKVGNIVAIVAAVCLEAIIGER